MLAVPRNESLWVGRDIWTPEAVHAVHAGREWYRLSAGAGSKGERGYDWQCRVLADPEAADWGRYLLFRRSLADPDDWQAYVAFAPQGCDLETLVAVAGRRWCIEHAFESARQETGLDDYEVRSAHGWYRHVTLALLAVVWAADLARPAPQKKSPGPPSLRAFRRARGLAGDSPTLTHGGRAAYGSGARPGATACTSRHRVAAPTPPQLGQEAGQIPGSSDNARWRSGWVGAGTEVHDEGPCWFRLDETKCRGPSSLARPATNINEIETVSDQPVARMRARRVNVGVASG